MLFRSASQDRPYHWGPYPAEVLPRDPTVAVAEAARPRVPAPVLPPLSGGPLARAARRYRDLFAGLTDGAVAPAPAPVPADPARRARDIKGGAFFLNAAGVGICEIPGNAWVEGAEPDGATHAVVILVAHGRVPEADNRAHGWVAPAVAETGQMRAAEIAVCVAGQIRQMGFPARAHLAGAGDLDLDRLAVLAGLAVRDGEGAIASPFLGTDFSLAVVTSTYRLATDPPLAPGTGPVRGVRDWWGINGAESGRERNRRARRPAHASRYPMEQVRRVDRPTTLILDDEVPRVPQRASFFTRAVHGDLGARTVAERGRFAYKHPFAMGMMGPIPAMAPLQDGPVAMVDTSMYSDPAANARAVKALSYFLGADLTGICEVPDYAWYSHRRDGAAIEPYHKYAVVMLIDQEFDTMEGASGDDWISGAQSMRAYMRGAEIAGIMADCLRDLGFPARPQTNVDSDVLQIPLVLLAGLGEMSRIGELVLNPFVGPRFKSVVLTTDMPLEVDRPIDFGLQGFCSNCWKCARECPCDAIPFGPKVMFNGYETWKPDVERCARYRLTNARGSACGRCMKTCPLNKVVTADGPQVTRLASWLGIHARWAKPLMVPVARWLDDRLGNGRRNPVKKWWLDLEVVDGVCVAPRASNERDIDPDKAWDAAQQRIAFYTADAMPPPAHAGPWPVDRKAALAAAEALETPAEARARKARGGPPPAHYSPRPPAG